jgi:endonuclease-3
MKANSIIKILNEILPDASCSLNYNKDYELLIATVLSAQCTDERVNKVTPLLFQKYDIFTLANANVEDIKDIITPCGNMYRKSVYIKNIAESLVNDYNGVVPNNREFLESLPGVGRKTANVVLSNLFDEPAFAVDTHVSRVSIRLGLASVGDDPLTIENKLMDIFPKKSWSKLHHQFLLFGRYTCKSRNPECNSCPFKKYCHYKKCI